MDKATPQTWSGYLAQMPHYLAALDQAVQLGSTCVMDPPIRPIDALPEKYLDQVNQLSNACDELIAQVSARMIVISARPPSSRQNPHQEGRSAYFIETDI